MLEGKPFQKINTILLYCQKKLLIPQLKITILKFMTIQKDLKPQKTKSIYYDNRYLIVKNNFQNFSIVNIYVICFCNFAFLLLIILYMMLTNLKYALVTSDLLIVKYNQKKCLKLMICKK